MTCASHPLMTASVLVSITSIVAGQPTCDTTMPGAQGSDALIGLLSPGPTAQSQAIQVGYNNFGHSIPSGTVIDYMWDADESTYNVSRQATWNNWDWVSDTELMNVTELFDDLDDGFYVGSGPYSFWGNAYNQVTINSNGVLYPSVSGADNSSHRHCCFENDDWACQSNELCSASLLDRDLGADHGGAIFLWWTELRLWRDARVLVGHSDEGVTISFRHIVAGRGSSNCPVETLTMQVQLSTSGNVRVMYAFTGLPMGHSETCVAPTFPENSGLVPFSNDTCQVGAAVGELCRVTCGPSLTIRNPGIAECTTVTAGTEVHAIWSGFPENMRCGCSTFSLSREDFDVSNLAGIHELGAEVVSACRTGYTSHRRRRASTQPTTCRVTGWDTPNVCECSAFLLDCSCTAASLYAPGPPLGSDPPALVDTSDLSELADLSNCGSVAAGANCMVSSCVEGYFSEDEEVTFGCHSHSGGMFGPSRGPEGEDAILPYDYYSSPSPPPPPPPPPVISFTCHGYTCSTEWLSQDVRLDVTNCRDKTTGQQCRVSCVDGYTGSATFTCDPSGNFTGYVVCEEARIELEQDESQDEERDDDSGGGGRWTGWWGCSLLLIYQILHRVSS